MERRERDRYRIWFPVRIRAESVEDGAAVTYDASDKGVCLLTGFPLDAGTEVTVVMSVGTTTPTERVVTGKVLRSDANDDDPFGLWRHRIAIEFFEPVVGLEQLLVRASEEHPLSR